MDRGGAGDTELQPGGIFAAEPVAGPQRPVAGEADAAGGAVGEVDPDRADVPEAEHRLLVLAAGAEQPGAAEWKRCEGCLEQDVLRLPFVDVVALHHALPAAHLVLVAGADPGGRVNVEVAPDLAAAEPRAQQQLGRAQRPTGDHHRLRLDPVGAGGAVLPRLLDRYAVHPGRAATVEDDPPHCGPGPDSRPGAHRPR